VEERLKPPLYYTLKHRLVFGQSEHGRKMGKTEVAEIVGMYLDFLFEKSDYKEENKQRWLEYATQNPAEELVVYISSYKQFPGREQTNDGNDRSST
jgi:hypothetical protein